MKNTTRKQIKKVEEIYGNNIKKKLKESNPKMPRFYCLPKIYKNVIVSSIGAPSYKLAKWLINELEKLAKHKGKSIKNSFEAADLIKKTKIDSDIVMFFFDVTALYPSIPVKEAILRLKNEL